MLAVATAAATIVVGVVGSVVAGSGFQERYVAVAFPFLAVAVAFGAAAIADPRVRIGRGRGARGRGTRRGLARGARRPDGVDRGRRRAATAAAHR